MPPNLIFEKRAIRFCNQLIKSKNKTVKTITGMAIHGSHSVLGHNIKYLTFKYNLCINEINNYWESKYFEQNDLLRLCAQIKELCILRDSPYVDNMLSRSEASQVITLLCTE